MSIDIDAESEKYESLTVVVNAEFKRVIEAAIKLRRSKGNLPGEEIDRAAFQTIITNYERGRALYDISVEYILRTKLCT